MLRINFVLVFFQISVRGVHPTQPQVLSCGPHLVYLAPHLLCVPSSQTGIRFWLWPQRVPPTTQREPPPRQPIQVRMSNLAQNKKNIFFPQHAFCNCISHLPPQSSAWSAKRVPHYCPPGAPKEGQLSPQSPTARSAQTQTQTHKQLLYFVMAHIMNNVWQCLDNIFTSPCCCWSGVHSQIKLS